MLLRCFAFVAIIKDDERTTLFHHCKMRYIEDARKFTSRMESHIEVQRIQVLRTSV